MAMIPAVGLALLSVTAVPAATHGRNTAASQPCEAGYQASARTYERNNPLRMPQHLYLTSPAGGAVYSFPLTNGIPSRTPNAVVTGLSYPVGVAVDGAGCLYVSDEGANVIDVFPPGSNGPAKPVRQMQVVVRYMALWRDFLIAQTSVDGIDVYSADGSGPTYPLEAILYYSADDGLAAGANGKLYLTFQGSLGDTLTVYDHALPPPRGVILVPAQIITNDPPTSYGGGLAVDQNEIFAEIDYLSSGPIRIAAYPIDANGSTKPSRVMITPSCNGGASTLSYSLAIYSRYLYEACTSANSVFLFDKRARGRIKPLFTLSGPFPDVFEIALGP